LVDRVVLCFEVSTYFVLVCIACVYLLCGCVVLESYFWIDILNLFLCIPMSTQVYVSTNCVDNNYNH